VATIPSPYTRTDAVTYVTAVAPGAWYAGGAVFAGIDAATGRVAGSIGAHDLLDGVAEVGYWTTPAARGRGLTTDALRTLTRWLLHDGGAARVELLIDPDNTGSIRVAEAAGFTAEGLLRQRALHRDHRIDVVMYSMLATAAAASSR
jgi:RimJ/RimL family protein N-acetyltransferase